MLQKSNIPALKALLKKVSKAEAQQLHEAIEAEQRAYVVYKFHSTVLDAWTAKLLSGEVGR